MQLHGGPRPGCRRGRVGIGDRHGCQVLSGEPPRVPPPWGDRAVTVWPPGWEATVTLSGRWWGEDAELVAGGVLHVGEGQAVRGRRRRGEGLAAEFLGFLQ